MGVAVEDMVLIPGGSFSMGSWEFYPEEAPVREVAVEPFLLGRAPVTNREFADFVDETGHVTMAERLPDQRRFPGAPAGSLVFTPSTGPVALTEPRNWWAYVEGACWSRPTGPQSDLDGLDDHPVVHIALADAEAYADWAGLRLPTEPEWERAARGGMTATRYAWGNELVPGGVYMANTWQGRFPFENTARDGHVGTSPVGRYPANPYGLVDMIGNVWEWTSDVFGSPPPASSPCCGASPDRDPIPFVIKGGSHLCAPNYCRRYRPAARVPETAESSTTHIGFRCASSIT